MRYAIDKLKISSRIFGLEDVGVFRVLPAMIQRTVNHVGRNGGSKQVIHVLDEYGAAFAVVHFEFIFNQTKRPAIAFVHGRKPFSHGMDITILAVVWTLTR
jgi:hypothetical protein